MLVTVLKRRYIVWNKSLTPETLTSWKLMPERHTYTHTYIHTYTHTYIYIHTHIQTYIYIHTYTHTHIYTHTYIYTYIYTYIHTYIHTNIHAYRYLDTGIDICAHIFGALDSDWMKGISSNSADLIAVHEFLTLTNPHINEDINISWHTPKQTTRGCRIGIHLNINYVNKLHILYSRNISNLQQAALTWLWTNFPIQ